VRSVAELQIVRWAATGFYIRTTKDTEDLMWMRKFRDNVAIRTDYSRLRLLR
jgi:hypothetical protein